MFGLDTRIYEMAYTSILDNATTFCDNNWQCKTPPLLLLPFTSTVKIHVA